MKDLDGPESPRRHSKVAKSGNKGDKRCPVCNHSVASDQTLEHFRNHRLDWAKAREAREQSTANKPFILNASEAEYAKRSGKQRCPDCFDWLPTSQLQKHFQEHRLQDANRLRGSSLVTDLRGCLHCAEIFSSEEEMEEHLVLAHPKAELSAKNVQGKLFGLPGKERRSVASQLIPSRTWKTIKRVDPADDLMRHKERKQNSSLDATVRYAHNYRERGYGSHPAHDDFSDESGPDVEKKQ